MKLLNLTLCNLASFEGEHVIDFSGEPLAGADLFSIVGETGSGKSTILDAICLALYGLAPRFCGAVNFKFYDRDNESKKDKELSPDDSRNIMRKVSVIRHVGLVPFHVVSILHLSADCGGM